MGLKAVTGAKDVAALRTDKIFADLHSALFAPFALIGVQIVYSYRSTTMGSTRVARRAGM